jgi:hypothetical protein
VQVLVERFAAVFFSRVEGGDGLDEPGRIFIGSLGLTSGWCQAVSCSQTQSHRAQGKKGWFHGVPRARVMAETALYLFAGVGQWELLTGQAKK